MAASELFYMAINELMFLVHFVHPLFTFLKKLRPMAASELFYMAINELMFLVHFVHPLFTFFLKTFLFFLQGFQFCH